MLCEPPGSVVAKLAEPAATVPVPSVVEFSMKATVPVGGITLAPVLTVAVKVIGLGKTGLGGLKPKEDVVTNAPTAGTSHMPRPCVAIRTLWPAVTLRSNTATRG